MDVRDLAPALVAVADLLRAANKEINGDASEVRVHVNGTFKAGSFGIDLIASQQLLSHIKDIFSGNTATAISNASAIMGLVGLTGGGLIGLLRKLKGHPPVRIEQKADSETVWVNEVESIEVSPHVVRLYWNKVVRTSLEKLMSPLERDGICNFGVVTNDKVVLDVHDDEVGSFSAVGLNADAEMVSDILSSRKLLLIESLAFKDGNKWRVHDGNYAFHVSIEDEEFLGKIDSGKRFGKGDMLIVDLRQVQTVLGAKLLNESIIVKVWEHRRPLQASLL
ncbi:hypothetical protein D0B32_01705 [Paraburkholderia sp. DHOC27]|nr:hypothetical protein D0B32_01705 [Paraburkholderia sp. DHOC27]